MKTHSQQNKVVHRILTPKIFFKKGKKKFLKKVVIRIWYLLFPTPIFNTLFDHSCTNNHNQRKDSTDSCIRSKLCECQDASHQEVEIGHSPKLLKQWLRQESGKRIFCGADSIICIVPDPSLQALWLVAEHHPGISPPSNVWVFPIEWCFATC